MIDKKLLGQFADAIINSKQTIAVAESVTAGLLQQALAAAENATDFFEGGITAYNITQKVKHLNINRAHAKTCNCVSQKVAVQMARGATKLFNSNWGIGVTGYASPVPELGIKKPYAYYAIVCNNKLSDAGCIDAKHIRQGKVQEEYVCNIIKNLVAILRENNSTGK